MQTLRLKSLLLSLTLLVSACAHQSTIYYDTGGIIHKKMKRIDQMPPPRMVKGLCASACVYVFAYPDTCVSKKSRIIIHSAQAAKRKQAVYWNNKLADAFEKGGRHKLANFYRTQLTPYVEYEFSGEEMNKYFDIQLCD